MILIFSMVKYKRDENKKDARRVKRENRTKTIFMMLPQWRKSRVFKRLKNIFTVFSLIYFTLLILSGMCRYLHGIEEIANSQRKTVLYNNDDNYRHDVHTENLEELFHATVKEYYMKYRQHYKPILKSKKYWVGDESNMKTFPVSSVTRCDSIANKGDIKDNNLLILIHSEPKNIKRRLSIRYSWGMPGNPVVFRTRNNKNGDTTDRLPFRYLFVIGKTRESHITNMVLKELEEFDDILGLDFQDNYRNLAFKTLESLSWVSKNCASEFILKTDDDCYVNVNNVLDFLKKHENKKSLQTLYTGRVQWMMPAIHDPVSKFYIPRDIYNELLLPPYVSGGGYLFSGRLLEALLEEDSRVKTIPNEDAHIGLLMKNVGVKPSENFNILPFIYCNESLWLRPTCDFVKPFVIHGVENYGQLWMHYHVTILKGIPGVCKQSGRLRRNAKPPLYCPVNLEM